MQRQQVEQREKRLARSVQAPVAGSQHGRHQVGVLVPAEDVLPRIQELTTRGRTPSTAPDVSAPGASASGWAIELQETQLLVRHALAPPPQRPKGLSPSDLDPHEPRLGVRQMALTLLCCLFLLLIVGALDGMQQYARIHTRVDDALSHLHAAQALLDARQPGQPLDAATLAQLNTQLGTAEGDFAALQTELGNPSGVVQLGTFVPHLSSRLAAAARLASQGDDACQGLLDLVAASNDLVQLRADGFLDANGQLTRRGRLSPAAGALMLDLHEALTRAATAFDAAASASSPADLSVLPPSLATPADRTTLQTLLATWPQVRAELVAPDGWHLLTPFVLGTQFAAR